MTYSQIRSNKEPTRSKRWVGGDLIEGDLCSFLSCEVRKKIKKRNKMKTKFEIEINDTGKKHYVFCP